MPNYCNNYLKVSGDAKELKKFLKKGITEETKSYHYIVDETGEKELVWRMSNYHPTPEPLTRTISPARDGEWVNEWEVQHAKKRIEEQPSNIAKLELELQTATGEQVNDLLDQLKEAKKPIAIPELIPCANGTEKDRKALIKKYGTDNWYDWNVKNWGTKWEASYPSVLEKTAKHIVYSFDTAWSPPITWQERVAKMYPKLKFVNEYEEGGMAFAGRTTSIKGDTTDEGLPYEGSEEDEEI